MSINRTAKTSRHIKKGLPGDGGFTIIEVLIAIFILTIGLLAIASMQVSAIHGNKTGNDISHAIFLAQDKLEELKSSADITGLATSGSDQDGIYTRNWQIGPSGTNSRTVTVTVSWITGGNTHSVSLNTISRGGGY
ncbi:MAG TPA: prepilin-type N-terminal cleavage/methylation domain-containing protein, partial [Syntrophales bacterium]|nr:prepilin-type N-terminal cleavage/methylation domain-containing protein [Syntrophales bacterium]HPQ43428.1 prepilin-type N-terminal cleavage/methylation domain-containing protein [Syntrophales bacterium]